MDVQIAKGWKEMLSKEFQKDYFKRITEQLKIEIQSRVNIYPPGPMIFNAFNTTDFNEVKVVIIGQDPYHGPGQAHGLSFSVQPGVKPPPSLVNIYKEIESDLGIKMPRNFGDLTAWAKQGVLMLNATLTVRANQPNSHAGLGWNQFTDAVIQKLNQEKEHLVFLLWGNFAKVKGSQIDQQKHLVLKAAHPSPFAADKGFFGCKHFSKTNQYLIEHGLDPIDWLINLPHD
ncbi:MAG: uracil-DNA glycosylase [Bacteroidota bacterium]|jgi:uracil-DNA glycosylase|nr:uracil-DNA glycosylase [Chitinophagaceae bacterium]MCE2758383.1 uracil-DNA glycosylase [Chitinophagaceae bacterium]